ncbi:flagellar biosynthesis repressor FlbT [Terrarubrum flagellatum]|uniref:flagellar biosynthesis repressor FlbT n=1 Tax=Terrirubrum flagellatum TaxID=2895980 RepID=UPI00314564AE
MALKVELKPHERVIIGKALIRNGDARSRLFIEGAAPILREKDILTAQTADTPARRIYLATQLMYLDGETDSHHNVYFDLVREFLQAAPSALPIIAEINSRILAGDLYKALRSARQLVAYEQELLARVTESGAKPSAGTSSSEAA